MGSRPNFFCPKNPNIKQSYIFFALNAMKYMYTNFYASKRKIKGKVGFIFQKKSDFQPFGCQKLFVIFE